MKDNNKDNNGKTSKSRQYTAFRSENHVNQLFEKHFDQGLFSRLNGY